MQPAGPLVISGIRKTLEQAVFLDPLRVRQLATGAGPRRRHAEWLLAAGENRRAPVCPNCRVFMADYMVIHHSRDRDFSITGITCSSCAGIGDEKVCLLPLKLSSAMGPKLPGDRKRLAQYLKKVWGLNHLTAEKAFEFFSAPGREESKQLALPL